MKRITSLLIAFCFCLAGFSQTVFPSAQAANYGKYYNDETENLFIALFNEETYETVYIELLLPVGTGVDAIPAGTYPIVDTYAVNTAVAAGEDEAGYLIGCLLESIDMEAYSYVYKLVTEGNVVVAVNEGTYTITMTGTATAYGSTTTEEVNVTYTGALAIADERPMENFTHDFTTAALYNYYDFFNETTDNFTIYLSDGEEGTYDAQFDILAPAGTGLTVPVGTYTFTPAPEDYDFTDFTSGTAIGGVYDYYNGIQLGGLLLDYENGKANVIESGTLTIAQNGEDYTITVTTVIEGFAENVTLTYSGALVAEQGQFTDLKPAKKEMVKAYGIDGMLYIDTETTNAHIQVFDMQGRSLVNDVTAPSQASYYIGTNQIVLVRVNGQAVKVKM